MSPDKRRFGPVVPPTPDILTLSGLAVTRGHYLVVGVVGQGLLIFDLHRGGPPILLLWTLPEGETFTPWDLAATPDGGLLVLDRALARYWQLNRDFQLVTTLPDAGGPPPPTTFQPKEAPADAEPRRTRRLPPHEGYPLSGDVNHDAPADPISIDSGPDGTVLILNAPPDDAPSAVYEYTHAALRTVYALDYSVSDPDSGSEVRPMHAHDFAYMACVIGADPCPPLQAVQSADEGETVHLLFVAKRDGNQVIVYQLDPAKPDIDAQPDYLPLRRWQEKSLVAAGGQVYYDFPNKDLEGRWIPLGIFLDCEYATAGVIRSPIDFERRYRSGDPQNRFALENGMPEQPFDSNIIGCVWHRLFLDAEIPPGAQVLIDARAADDADTLAGAAWIAQPKPYQRSDGAELPYYDPYAARRNDATLGDRAGTWEILLQDVVGRYVQVQLTLLGTGRVTPEIQALRLWYPRFSYRDHYLPAIYGEDAVSASLTERLLANFEGSYTELEDKIVQISTLLDPRSTPPDALDWLAGWLGVVLHPLWDEERRRFFIRFAHRLYRQRGTLAGVIAALRIFLDDEVIDEAMADELFDPRCAQHSRIRIVEHFLTRDVAGTVFGDPTEGTADGVSVADAAHRFTVLVPYRFERTDMLGDEVPPSEARRMVERIVEMEKPAHTWFEIKEYWNMFRVGEARLGLDTQIGYSTHFDPLVLGEVTLPNAHLGCPYPYNVQDRFVMERNRVVAGG